MPKIVKTPQEIQNSLLSGNIKKRMNAFQVTNKQMGSVLGIHPGTFEQKTNHPERFTFPELLIVFHRLRFPDSEIIEVMRMDK